MFSFLTGMHHSRHGNSRPQESLNFAAVIKNAKREVSVVGKSDFKPDVIRFFTAFFNFEALFLRLRLTNYRIWSILDVYGGEYDEENKIVIWPITNTRNQRLYFSHLKDKRFTIHPEINKTLMLYVKLDCKNTFSRKNILAGSSIYQR